MEDKGNKEILEYIQESDLINNVLVDAQQGIIVYDDQIRYQFWNKTVERITGLNFKEVRGKKAGDVFSFLNDKGVMNGLTLMLSNGEQIKKEFNFTLNDKKVWVLHHSYPIKNKSGKIIGGLTILTDITTRKSYEEQLKKSEERFNIAVSSINDGIWDWEIDANHVFFSEIWKKQLGYENHELTNEFNTFESLLHPDDRKRVLNFINEYFNNEIEIYDNQFRMRHKNGSYRWIQARGAALRDKNGRPYRMTGSHTDITKNKIAEDKIKESHSLLNKLANQLPGFIYQFRYHSDGSMSFPYSSDKMNDVFETNPSKVQKDATPILSKIHTEDLEAVLKTIIETAEKGEVWNYTFRMILPQKGLRWMHTMASPEKLIDGTYLWYGYTKDITEAYHAERRYKISQERWQYALEGSKDGVWDWNIQTGYIYFSPQYKSMFGYADDEMENTIEAWNNIIHPDDLHQTYIEIQKHIDGKVDYYNTILRILCKDGSYKWVYDRGKIMEYDAENKPLRMIGTHTDINDRKELEENLKKLNTDKDLFISILSHDLKSPFGSITGLLELLSKNYKKYNLETIGNHLRILKESAKSTFGLLEEILMWSRVSSGKMSYNPETFQIKYFMEVALKVLKFTAENKKIDIDIQIDKDFVVVGDFNMLKTVVRNLISNAIKFTKEQGVITISASKKDTEILIVIADSGIGMSNDMASKLFDPTQKISVPGTANEKGTGIGLLLCKEIVTQHKGKIWAESELGKGTQFSFTIGI